MRSEQKEKREIFNQAEVIYSVRTSKLADSRRENNIVRPRLRALSWVTSGAAVHRDNNIMAQYARLPLLRFTYTAAVARVIL